MILRAILLIAAVLCGCAAGVGQLGLLANAQAKDSERPPASHSEPVPTHSQGTIISLRGGWTDLTPFQYPAERSIEGAQGLDVEIMSEIFRAAGLEAQLYKRNWQDQLQDLEDGTTDFAIGAFRPADGDDRFHYSSPYRWARTWLFVSDGDKVSDSGADAYTILQQTADFRLGVIQGRLFQDPELNEIIAHAIRTDRAVYAQNEEENLQNLVNGRIDGFVGDRLGVSAAALQSGLKFKTAEIVIPGISGVHIIFSKKTVPVETVARINSAIAKLEKNGTLDKRLHARIFSLVMAYALDSRTFHILAIVGTIAFALSGVLIAYREDFSFFGALVLSALPAVGGGVLRDVLFGRHPIGVMSNPLYLYLVGATVLAGFCTILAIRRMSRGVGHPVPNRKKHRVLTMENIQETCDAAGMAAFTVSGLAVAVAAGSEPLWLWGPVAAMISAAGGGILRDVVRQSGKVASIKDDFYAEVPLLWGLALSLFLLSRPSVPVAEEVGTAIIVTFAGAFLTRMAAVIFGWRAIPFAWPERHKKG